MSEKIIICTIDDNYVQHCIVMLKSLFENNTNSRFNIFIISDGLSKENMSILNLFFNSNSNSFKILHVDKSILKNAPVFGHVSLATYYRLLIPILIPEKIEKALFLDADIIVRGNIEIFWDVDIENYSHIAIEEQEMPTEFKINLGLSENTKYFNAGVMFINLKWWRTNLIFDKALKFLAENTHKIKLWDQDVLNVVLNEKWLEFPIQYNSNNFIFYNNKTHINKNLNYLSAYYNPIIVHFAGSDNCKPWFYNCNHFFKNEYYKYLALTPFKNFIPFNSPKTLSWRDQFYLFRKNFFKQQNSN